MNDFSTNQLIEVIRGSEINSRSYDDPMATSASIELYRRHSREFMNCCGNYKRRMGFSPAIEKSDINQDGWSKIFTKLVEGKFKMRNETIEQQEIRFRNWGKRLIYNNSIDLRGKESRSCAETRNRGSNVNYFDGIISSHPSSLENLSIEEKHLVQNIYEHELKKYNLRDSYILRLLIPYDKSTEIPIEITDQIYKEYKVSREYALKILRENKPLIYNSVINKTKGLYDP